MAGQPSVWRNISYGDDLNATLNLLARPALAAPAARDSNGEPLRVAFGEQLQVRATQPDGNDLWLQLESGHWALARGAGVVNCVETSYWKRHGGRIPDSAFYGQNFPSDMRSEGFAGSSSIVVVSCSGDSFWREVNIEMLCRDIATATLFEGPGGGDGQFQEWVANYAMNVSNYGRGKAYVVIVKPTRAWKTFQDGCRGVPLETIKQNVGLSQEKELTWAFKVIGGRASNSLGHRWEDIEFITSFVFFRKYCSWTPADCKKAANCKLAELVRKFSGLASDRCILELQYAFWIWMEAFDEEPLSLKEEAAICCSCLRWMARETQQDRVQLDPIDAAAEGSSSNAWTLLWDQLRQKAPGKRTLYLEEPLVATFGLVRDEVERLRGRQQGPQRDQGDTRRDAETISRQHETIQRLEAENRRLNSRVDHLDSLAQQQAASLAQMQAAQAAQAASPGRASAPSYQPELEPEGRDQQAAAKAPSPNAARAPEPAFYVVTASADRQAHMWELKTGRQLQTFKGHTSPLWSCILSRDGARLFTTADDGTAKMWDVSSGKCIRTYAGQRGSPNWAAVTPDMRFLITAVNDGTAKVWQVENGLFVKDLVHAGCVCSVVVSRDGKFLYTAEDAKAPLGRKFSVGDWKQVRTFDGKNKGGLYSCCLSGDGKLFFTASHDGTTNMFNAELGGNSLHTFSFSGEGGASNVMASPTDPYVFVARDDDGDGDVQMFATDTRRLVRAFKGHARGVSAMWVTPDGRWLLTASWDKSAKVWDIQTGTCMLTYTGHSNLVQGIVCG